MNEALRKKLHKFVLMMSAPSSWRGLVVVLTGAGAAISPAHSEAIVSGGLILAGLIAIYLEP
jgi:hypothetical protein